MPAFVKGLNTATQAGASPPGIALLHFDADLYESADVVLRHLVPHLVPGNALSLVRVTFVTAVSSTARGVFQQLDLTRLQLMW